MPRGMNESRAAASSPSAPSVGVQAGDSHPLGLQAQKSHFKCRKTACGHGMPVVLHRQSDTTEVSPSVCFKMLCRYQLQISVWAVIRMQGLEGKGPPITTVYMKRKSLHSSHAQFLFNIWLKLGKPGPMLLLLFFFFSPDVSAVCRCEPQAGG